MDHEELADCCFDDWTMMQVGHYADLWICYFSFSEMFRPCYVANGGEISEAPSMQFLFRMRMGARILIILSDALSRYEMLY
jgi:hypothetical protein